MTALQRTLSGLQILAQRVPITDRPALIQAPPFIFGKTRVIEDDAGAGSARDQLEFHDRINAGRPISGTPGLNDSLVRHQFNIAALNAPAEELECPAGLRLNFSCVLGKSAELFRVEQDFIDARGGGLQINFLMDGCTGLLAWGVSRGATKTAEN